MGCSSYDKVYERMADTKTVKALLAEIPLKLNDVHVLGVDFTLRRPDAIGRPATATPSFNVKVPGGVVHTENGQVYLDLGNTITEKSTNAIVEELFGKPGGVPTYFCRKSVVLGEDYRKGTHSFAAWLRSSMRDKFDEDFARAQERVKEEVCDWKSSELVARLQREFLVKNAIEDIKMALGAYDHLGKEVLKDAIDLYLCHAITED